jgi:formylglycine-generating enzyme required for sulfatase activity
LEAGDHEIRIVSERYLPEIRKINIQGMEKRQTLEVRLRPGWGKLIINTVPKDALLRVDGKDVGRTPLSHEPLQGERQIEIVKEGWKPVMKKIEIRAGLTTKLNLVHLERIDGTLDVKTSPAGATVTVDGQYRGRTPIALSLVSRKDFQVKLAKLGYSEISKTVSIEGGKTTPLNIRLKPEYGTVFLTTRPSGATLKLNGRPYGRASQRLRLPTVTHRFEISKPGYQTFKTTVTPRAGISKKIDVTLKSLNKIMKERAKRGILAPGGQKLRLIHIPRPIQFKVGASRREAGRRSNETQYFVELSRSFLISEKEVTNAEFKKFRPGHRSGSYQGLELDGPNQPVVSVSWDDAARYTNWLSKKKGLLPAYKEENKKMIPITPVTSGYRLPTEAEWVFVARYDGGQRPLNDPLRFPWGERMPPPNETGNYADDGAKRLPFTIPGYIDGFPVSAPVGKFKPNVAGVYDIGGNVAEWCHDFYSVQVGRKSRPPRDPVGPSSGRFHVIKGASWRSGGISELRLSYRDYAFKPRNDIGFRIARYAKTPKK